MKKNIIWLLNLPDTYLPSYVIVVTLPPYLYNSESDSSDSSVSSDSSDDNYGNESSDSSELRKSVFFLFFKKV